MLRLWSEWDIGEGNLVFASKQALMTWLHTKSLAVVQMAAEEQSSVEDFVATCFDEGYFSIEPLTYVTGVTQ